MRGALIDLRPLGASQDFRRLWWTTSLSAIGSQFTLFAVLLQVWQLTGSPWWTGAIGLAHGIPVIVVSLLGGALADRVDRRALILVGSAGQLVTASLLAVQAALGVDSVLLVLGLVVVQTSFASISMPARRTLVPRLLAVGLVPAGLALTHISFQVSMLLGPALAGLVAAGWGLTACYAVDAVFFAVAMYGVARLPAIPPLVEEPGSEGTTGKVLEGLRFVVRRPVLRGAFLSDMAQTLLAMPVALFPMVNDERFGGSPGTLGLFMSSVAVGGVAASLLSGLYTRAPRPGVVMLVAALTWGVALAGFGLVDGFALTMGALVVAGAADTVSVVCRGTITQLATPDALRGRVAAAEGIVGMGGPDLGNVRAGAVAGVSSAEVALVSGGVLCVLGVATVAWRVPAVRRFDLRHDPVEPQLASRRG
jgi:MFS family permease